MAKDETHEGSKNFETWAINLWINNDQGTQERCLEVARRARAEDGEDAQNTLADQLKEEVEDAAEELNLPLNGPPFSDLLNAALGEVDWYEIAEGLLETLAEQD